MKYECQYCYRTYDKDEDHSCEEEEMWRKTLIGQGELAGKALEEFTRAIMEEAIKSRKVLERIFRKCINGKSAPSKDDN